MGRASTEGLLGGLDKMGQAMHHHSLILNLGGRVPSEGMDTPPTPHLAGVSFGTTTVRSSSYHVVGGSYGAFRWAVSRQGSLSFSTRMSHCSWSRDPRRPHRTCRHCWISSQTSRTLAWIEPNPRWCCSACQRRWQGESQLSRLHLTSLSLSGTSGCHYQLDRCRYAIGNQWFRKWSGVWRGGSLACFHREDALSWSKRFFLPSHLLHVHLLGPENHLQ